VGTRADRLQNAHLYLVCDDQPSEFLQAALRGGVDVVQLRMKQRPDDAVLTAAARFAALCERHGALFILNDRPDLAAAANADGVHLGQDDTPAAEARSVVGPDRIIGLSTHTRSQIDAAAQLEVDYIGVGPVYETPTKPGRPGVGLDLVRYAAGHAQMPFFAIGGMDAARVHDVVRAGATRIAVVRALTESTDPELTAAALRCAEERGEASVGATQP
jgi:thiamine-phosphate pyrophosphorylase